MIVKLKNQEKRGNNNLNLRLFGVKNKGYSVKFVAKILNS